MSQSISGSDITIFKCLKLSSINQSFIFYIYAPYINEEFFSNHHQSYVNSFKKIEEFFLFHILDIIWWQ